MAATSYQVYTTAPKGGIQVIKCFDDLTMARAKLDEIRQIRLQEMKFLRNVSLISKRDDEGKIISDVWQVCNIYKQSRQDDGLVVQWDDAIIIEELGILTVVSTSEQKTAITANSGAVTSKREKVLTGEEYVEFVKNYFSGYKAAAHDTSTSSDIDRDVEKQLKQLKVYRLESLWSLSQKELSQLYYWILSRIGDKFPIDYVIHLELLNYFGNLLGRSALKNIVSGNRYLETAKLMGYSVPTSSLMPEWVDQLVKQSYDHLVTCSLLDEYSIPSNYDLREKLLAKLEADLAAKFKVNVEDKVKLIQRVYGEEHKEAIPLEFALLVGQWVCDLGKDDAIALISWAQGEVKKLTTQSQSASDGKAKAEVANNTNSSSTSTSTNESGSSATESPLVVKAESASSTGESATNAANAGWRLAEYFNLLGRLYANDNIDEEHLKNLYYFKAASMGDANGVNNLHTDLIWYHWLPLLATKVDYFKLSI